MQSLPLVDYVDFYRKWLNAVQLHQSLVAQVPHRPTLSTSNSIWSPAYDAERKNVSLPSNILVPSNASVFDLPCFSYNKITVPGCRYVVTSMPEADTTVRKLLAISDDNRRSWNQPAAM